MISSLESHEYLVQRALVTHAPHEVFEMLFSLGEVPLDFFGAALGDRLGDEEGDLDRVQLDKT